MRALDSHRLTVPVLCEEKDRCCGCTACYAKCPVNCIAMNVDEEGFSYPAIDDARCIRCHECVRVCAFKRDQASYDKVVGERTTQIPQGTSRGRWEMFEKPLTYAAKHRSIDVRMASRSGGVFTALSDLVLSRGGVVYGCALDGEHRACHIRATTARDRDRMRESKYVQSDMGETFKQVRDDLAKGHEVLFTGTSCQIAGLRSYLGSPYEKLVCVDVVCMGVPSPRVWHDYIAWTERKTHSRVESVCFRNKRDFGWKASIESLFLEGGRRIDAKVFTILFLDLRVLRRSCYVCPYKDIVHPGDLTLADYWGIVRAVPGFDDDRGVSLVLANNEKGKAILQEVHSALEIVPTRIEDSMQPSLVSPCAYPDRRDRFWHDYNAHGFDWVVRHYGAYGFVGKAIRRARIEVMRLFNP